MFLTMMVIGLAGLVMMALPAIGGHHLPSDHGHGLGPAANLGHHAGHAGELGPAPASGHATGAGSATAAHATSPGAAGSAVSGTQAIAARAAPAAGALRLATGAPPTIRRFVPSPRAAFSVFALYGAFGNALVHAGHLTMAPAAVIAIGPALLIEWVLIRPVWNLMFRFQSSPSSPLEELILADARAVVPFRNGRGMIATVRDGRSVQLPARLCDEHATRNVTVGQRLRIEDVDARRERVTVSVLSNDPSSNDPGPPEPTTTRT